MYTITLIPAVTLVLSLIGTALCGLPIGVAIILSAMNALFAVTISMLIGTFVAAYCVPMRLVEYGGKLVPLRDSNGVLSFVCVSFGPLGSYHLMQLFDDGRMAPIWVPASETVHLVEDPDLKEFGHWSKTCLEPDTTAESYNWAVGTEGRTMRHEFRVPIGTIVHRCDPQRHR